MSSIWNWTVWQVVFLVTSSCLAGEKPRHWAFVAPNRPGLPEVRRADWVRNEIDRYVLAHLERIGQRPAPEADKVSLIRRLYLDLLGLPPSVAEVDAFVADTRADSYAKLVDRLLQSPHYGERWGRHWLDAARYADSDGYEKDKARQVWQYRAWVIAALNQDMPYDRFIIEQLAGDLLPNATQDQRVATGFLRNSMINEEGGIDPEQFRMEAMFDRMDAIGKSILGLTIQCAQCHDHKYDPLTQKDYYRMFAVLNNDHEANIAVYTPEEQMQRRSLFARIRAIEAELQRAMPDWQDQMARWEEQVRRHRTEWTVLRPNVDEISTGGQKYLPMSDGSFLAQGYAPTKHTVKLTVRTDLASISAFRLELLTDPNLPLGGPGRSIWGTCGLTEFDVEAASANQPDKPVKVVLGKATADLNIAERPLDAIFDDRNGERRVIGPVGFAMDGKDETAWGSDAGPGRRNRPRELVFNTSQPIVHPEGTVLTFYLKQNHGGWNSDDNQNNNLGRFRLSITSDPEAKAGLVPAALRPVVDIPREQRSAAQHQALFSYWRTLIPQWQEANDEIERLWAEHPKGSSQLVLMARENPRATHILERGNFLQPTEPVEPGVPAFLHPLAPNQSATRLSFAEWLVDRRSPTTARALVNRVWQAYFGVGLVSTSEDLGTQSAPPSHPQLLDWLAVEFMERGWSLKALHRLIVMSATYRQTSQVGPELYVQDPENRRLARASRFRVDAEIVRDIALEASGLLDPEIGGPSIYPPLPGFMLNPPVSYGPKVWYESKGPERYRRALYTFRYRSVPYPSLQAFDAPNGDFSCVRRARSNTPLQALMTLNEPVFMECARALAGRALCEGGDGDDQRLSYAFRLCLARHPSQQESQELLGLLREQEQRFGRDVSAAVRLTSGEAEPEHELAAGGNPAQLAAWTAVARVLLNLDETITRE